MKPPAGKPDGTVFTSVSCGESHVCGLLNDGTHLCQDIGYDPQSFDLIYIDMFFTACYN